MDTDEVSIVYASHKRKSPQPAKERANVLRQQCGLLHRGEVAAPGHLGPALHIVGALGPLAGRAVDLDRE